jgi:hypothetical protein
MIAVDEFDRGDPGAPPVERRLVSHPVSHRVSHPVSHAPAHSPAVDEDSLSDDDLRSEIELVAELVVAASTSDVPLSQPDIDRILGLDQS